MKKITGLFDLDDTLVDYTGGLIKSLNAKKSPFEPKYHSIIPRNKKNKTLVEEIRNKNGWWQNLEKLEHGFNLYELAQKFNHDIYITTQGPNSSPNAWSEKFLWSKKETPNAKLIITQNKSIINGDYLVDDYPPYLKDWLKTRKDAIAIMPVHSLNKNFFHKQVIKYDGKNIDEIKKVFMYLDEKNKFHKL